MQTSPMLNRLPEDVLLQLARLLNGTDLISFSFAFQASYLLSLSSVIFWKHDIIPGLLDAGLQTENESNSYRQAALKSWRLRKTLSSDRDILLRDTRQVELDGVQIAEVIIPGTHYLLTLSKIKGKARLICVDLLAGALLDVSGDIEPNAFKLDAVTNSEGNFHILVAGVEHDSDVYEGSDAYAFTVYEGVLKLESTLQPPTLVVNQVARKLFRSQDVGQVRKMAIEGYNIVAETGFYHFLHGPSPPLFIIVNWNPSKVSKPAVWDGPRAHHMFAWQAAGDYLFITYFKTGMGSQLYALSFQTLYEGVATGLTPFATPFPSFEPSPLSGIYRIVVDRSDLKDSEATLRSPMVLMGLAVGERGPAASRVYEFPVRVLHQNLIWREPEQAVKDTGSVEEDDEQASETVDAPQIPVRGYGGARVEFPAPPNLVTFPSPQYMNVARLSNGLFWGLCDQRERIQESDLRAMHGTQLHICDITTAEAHNRVLKEVKDLPQGQAHAVDMDVGVVCIVQPGTPRAVGEDGQEVEITRTTMILVHWYS